jgi:hypothetical protein
LEGQIVAQTLSNADEAKEFLVGKLVAQAERNSVPLSDAERKMMYYSVETPSVADAVADQFEEDRREEYEEKIASLARDAVNCDDPDRADCINAYRELSKGDHYLTVLAGCMLGRGSPRLVNALLEAESRPRRAQRRTGPTLVVPNGSGRCWRYAVFGILLAILERIFLVLVQFTFVKVITTHSGANKAC